MISSARMGASPSRTIFKDVYFAVILGKDLDQVQSQSIIDELEVYGGTHRPLDSFPLQEITHLIATTTDFPAYQNALDAFVHIVTPKWIEKSILKNKPLSNLRSYSPDPYLFLSDVTVCCADDIPQGDKAAIIGGVLAMGGQYSEVMTKLVTHTVALTMDNSQCRLIVDKGLSSIKPVLPHWFDDCFRLGKKIDCKPYLLPEPTFWTIDKTSTPHAKIPSDLRHARRVSPGPLPGYETGPSVARSELHVFRGKNVMLHNDLGIGKHSRQSLQDIIAMGGGLCVSQVKDADMLICQYRFGTDFETALKAKKDVGNLSWFYNIVNYNRWTSPTRRLLHYPLPIEGTPGQPNFRIGVPGTQDMTIAVSNFAGEARIYLESLVKALGGKYTKTLTPGNSHLITAHSSGDKYEAAQDWNINVVNPLWLEESYAKGRMQAMTNKNYTYFPSQTNFSELLGQTQIDLGAIMEHLNQMDSTSGDALEASSGSKKTPSPAKAGILDELDTYAENSITRTGKKSDAAEEVHKAEYLSSSLPSGGNDKENVQRPNGRNAKEKALNKLHAMASDIALFEKESKRVGGVIYGGRRVSDIDRIRLKGQKRRSIEFEDQSGAEDELGQSTPLSKKSKTEKEGQSTSSEVVRVLVTGFPVDEKARRGLEQLKVKFATKSSDQIDILVAARLSRTKKFLSALGHNPIIVDAKWIVHMLKKRVRLPLEHYILEDEEGEKKYGVNLDDVRKRAGINKAKGGVLKEWTIFCTENVRSGFETYKGVAAANGAVCVLFKGRETALLRDGQRRSRQAADTDGVGAAESSVANAEDSKARLSDLYLISDISDKPLWSKFSEIARSEGYCPRIVAPDWLLDVIMGQDLSIWRDEYLLTAQ